MYLPEPQLIPYPPPPPVGPEGGEGGGRRILTLQPKFCQGFPPCGQISKKVIGPFPVASPCAVAPDQWGGASMGGCGTVGVGEEDAF